MRLIMLFVLSLLLAGICSANAKDEPNAWQQAGTRTFYDASGRIRGTATTHDKVTTFRDGTGRLTGTAERLHDAALSFATRRAD